MRAIGDGLREVEPRSSNDDDIYAGIHSPNYHTTPSGGLRATMDLTCISAKGLMSMQFVEGHSQSLINNHVLILHGVPGLFGQTLRRCREHRRDLTFPSNPWSETSSETSMTYTRNERHKTETI
ncbi:hypothetical protein TNCV_630561 [Trichonephila clavipes]|nr:hypothetical protein TNCV_630561 [Trichonephila clavipes]